MNMPDANGFWTKEEQRAEWEAAEKALLARRDKAQLAGDPTPEEAAQLAAADARLALARAAFGAAVRAVAAAPQAVKEPWKGATPKEAEAITDAERAQVRASRDEEDARVDLNRLSVAISAARAARRSAVS
jgi:hypothetical protein